MVLRQIALVLVGMLLLAMLITPGAATSAVSQCVSPYETLGLLYGIGTNEGDGLASVQVSGAYAYIAWKGRLDIANIANPRSPTLLTSYLYSLPFDGYRGVQVVGNRAYLQHTNLQVLDVTNPISPSLLTSQLLPFPVYHWKVVDDRAYVNDLQIYDVGDVNRPVLLGVYPYPLSNVAGIEVVEPYAFISDDGLTIVDISNPTNPTFKGRFAIPRTNPQLISSWDVRVVGDLAYVVAGEAGLYIIDVADKVHPTLRSHIATPEYATDLRVEGSFAYVFTAGGRLWVFDVSNSYGPILRGHYGGFVSQWDLDVVNDLLYLDYGGVLRIVRLHPECFPAPMYLPLIARR
jgi:hypothetical protein